jgi:hypothetical protein
MAHPSAMADLLLAETGEPINTTAPIAAANANINPMDRFIGLPPLVDVLRSFIFSCRQLYTTETADTSRMAIGEPGLSKKFVWRV